MPRRLTGCKSQQGYLLNSLEQAVPASSPALTQESSLGVPTQPPPQHLLFLVTQGSGSSNGQRAAAPYSTLMSDVPAVAEAASTQPLIASSCLEASLAACPSGSWAGLHRGQVVS